jgi:2,4-dienoyl-CoA reductase [(3E)-enoyl-CoA-producing], peroxisomal
MEIDTVGTFQMSRAAHPYLKRGGGVVVNISATLHYGATFYQVGGSALDIPDSVCLGLRWCRGQR